MKWLNLYSVARYVNYVSWVYYSQIDQHIDVEVEGLDIWFTIVIKKFSSEYYNLHFCVHVHIVLSNSTQLCDSISIKSWFFLFDEFMLHETVKNSSSQTHGEAGGIFEGSPIGIAYFDCLFAAEQKKKQWTWILGRNALQSYPGHHIFA